MASSVHRSGAVQLSKWLDSLGSFFKKDSESSVNRSIRELEGEAESAPQGARWAVYNRMGDVYLKAGDRVQALRHFGKAIDALLEDDQPEPARAVAKKVIRLHPEAVRPLCTLTWLDLASMKTSTAAESLKAYVAGALAGGQENLAAAQVLEMARIYKDTAFTETAVEALGELGFPEEATQVREWASRRGAPNAPKDRRSLYALCLKAAAGSNVEMKDQGTVT